MEEEKKKRLPRIGTNFPNETRCTRMVEGGACFRPGVWHIIWAKFLGSQSCEECMEFAKENLLYLEAHRMMIPECTSSEGMWYPEEGKCRIPRDRDDMLRGVFVL